MIWRRALEIFPWSKWLPTYGPTALRHDLIAGVTVGVMLIPQSMAYAVLAGVPPIFGLYASLAPLLIYPIFGSSRHLAIGVVAIDMLLVGSAVARLAEPGSPRFLALTAILTLMVGIFQLALSFLRFGFVAELFSRPIVAGFTTAAALLIVTSQAGTLLGLNLERAAEFHTMAWHLVEALARLDPVAAGMGCATLVLLLVFRRFWPVFPRALLVVVLGIAAAWSFDLDAHGVAVVGTIPASFPSMHWPELNLPDVGRLTTTALTLGLLQFMTVISLGRVYSAKHRYSLRPNQELLALGSANLAGCLTGGLPVSASFSRTAVNEQAGARSPLANVVAAGMVALAVAFLTPTIAWLPLPVLAGIIIGSALNLFGLGHLRYLFRTKRRDGYLALLTFVTAVLIGMEAGILVGITSSVVAFLYRQSRPHVAELGRVANQEAYRDISRFSDAHTYEGLIILRVDAGFSFFNSSFLKDYILSRSAERSQEISAVVIDGTAINDLDTTAVEALQEIVASLEEWEITIYFAGLKGPVRDVMERSGLGDQLGAHHFFLTVHAAVEYATRAMEPAETPASPEAPTPDA